MRYAIADIHGCSKTFETLLLRANLNKSDTLYLLGDYVDRGPDSCGVLTLVMGLMESGYDVRPLRGNHEEMMLSTYKQDHCSGSEWWTDSWLSEWGVEVIKSFSVRDLTDIPDKYWNFLDSLPLVEEISDYIFVHASLDATKSDPVRETGRHSMLWDNSWHRGGVKGKILVSGHVVSPLHKIHASIQTGHILLDNGCCLPYENGLGNLVMLNLDTKETIIQALVDELYISRMDVSVPPQRITISKC